MTFSPDQKAFTTNAGDRDYQWYEYGTTVTTGIASSLRGLGEGEHYYRSSRSGEIPIGKWLVTHKTGNCCHDTYPLGDYYHGIQYGKSKCLANYYSGWMAYCADCGELISPMLAYMSKEAAGSITRLDLGLDYYYLCPFCTNLEMGAAYGVHTCKAISFNKYKVEYVANRGSGYMDDSIHMYNNEMWFEGEEITPSSRLTKNAYFRIGYEFRGWNTEADGTGEGYKDQQEIMNLTNENFDGLGSGLVRLYAQWEESESILHINPNGGSYLGSTGITSIKGAYLTTYTADPANIKAPDGFSVSFDTKGGDYIAPMLQRHFFQEWRMILPFAGKLDGNIYTYLGTDQEEDIITAVYRDGSVTLPGAVKEDSSFGGWYYDDDCTEPAGMEGTLLTPDHNITLYAKWVELVLVSADNYTANRQKGAVDLSWEQNDGSGKIYKLYQSPDNTRWEQIYDAEDTAVLDGSVNRTFPYTGNMGSYTVPYTGLYYIEANGAQGGNCGSNKGGLGGKVIISVWLTKGEILNYTIGGQNGFGGGGSASMFAVGGGCTVISTKTGGNLLIAGGGGGASSQGSGGAGGSTAANIATGIGGQDGAAGGGGGHRGGSAGELAVHNHISACSHSHTGSAVSGGGCYTVKRTGERTLTCNVTVRPVDTATGTCGACGGTWHGTNWGLDHSGCGGGGNQKTGYCSKCGLTSGTKPSGYTHTYTETYLFYELGCGKKEGVLCGYTDGQVLTSKPAYGGSNYVNTSRIINNTKESGKNTGNGSITITAKNIGYIETLFLKGVAAADLGPPYAVDEKTVSKTADSGSQLTVSWQEPTDMGTAYYHKAESYQPDNLTLISTSNTTVNTLTTGVIGYYYLIDEKENTVVTAANGSFIKNPQIPVILTDKKQYLHLAAADKAGNISISIHILINSGEEEIAWPVMTDHIKISSDQQSVFPAAQEHTYYVKADGSTPFYLTFSGFLANSASLSYQINYLTYLSSSGSRKNSFRIYTENSKVIADEVLTADGSALLKESDGRDFLADDAYTVTKRSDYCKKLTAVQRFTMPATMDGNTVYVTPQAGAAYRNSIVYSDEQEDTKNSIYLIGDNTPPVITGLDILDSLDVIDQNGTEQKLSFTATDVGSGLRDFYAVITNNDNGAREVFYAAPSGVLELTLTEDIAIFNGDFTVEFHAVDNVGNERTESFGCQEFSLTVSLQRILVPHNPVFKAGESGILDIITTGYADRVEVIFPKELTNLNPQLNQIYIYETPSYRQEEALLFMVPLGTPCADFQITVRAYKDGTEIERYPRFNTIGVEGSVLDDIRTRLR